MLKLGLGIDKTTKKIAAFDADAQAFFNRVTAAGGTLTATEQTAVNTLVLELKGYSLWTSMQAIYPMVGASAAACAQNLKSSSFTGSFSSGWTFASTGVTPNGTSAYFNTTLVPNSVFANMFITMGLYLRTNNTTNATDMGVINTLVTGAIEIYSYYNTDTLNGCGQFANRANYATTNSSGFRSFARSSTTSFKAYLSNVLKNTNTTSDTTLISEFLNPIYIGARNLANTINSPSNKETAFNFIADSSFTQTDITNLYTAVQSFQTTLSRQV
jgi:hypothetical protein